MKKSVLFPVLALLVFAAGSFAFQANGAQSKALTRSDVEQIVSEYIMKNPAMILQSVDQYQRSQINERAQQALTQNKSKLFENDDLPFIGPKDGDIRIVEFFDFNCGYCKISFPTIQTLAKEDPKLKFIFIDLPILGPSSELAARWALAAKNQDKYFEYHAGLMEMKGGYSEESLTKLATDLGLDAAQMKTDAASEAVSTQIEANQALAAQMGVSGTPGFVIEDEVFSGALSLEQFRSTITAKREKKASGTSE